MADNYREQNLFDLKPSAKPQGPVECLGMTFENDEKRREYFLEKLREKLKDPEFRKIEGFPIGSDEDILALSDPPYYTACPNPFWRDILNHWRSLHKANRASSVPVCTDISGGSKTTLAYTLHTYHSKIPPETLSKLIAHYTQAGDIVLDPFCGSGMTGLAVCSVAGSKGRPLLCFQGDFSSAATFISHVYVHAPKPESFLMEAKEVLQATGPELDALYRDEDGPFEYTLYSDVFLCPECGNQVIFWDAAVDVDTMSLKKSMKCPYCDKDIDKRTAVRPTTTLYDPVLRATTRLALQVPVARKYGATLQPLAKGYNEQASSDLESATIPIVELGSGANLNQPQRSHGLTHVHHLFTWRNLRALALLWDECGKKKNAHALRFILTSFMVKTGSKLHNIGFKKGSINLAGQLPNTYYIPNLTAERHLGKLFEAKVQKMYKYLTSTGGVNRGGCNVAIGTVSALYTGLPDESVDYIVTDPPFGGFVNYGELSLVWEAWLGVRSNRASEAIIYDAAGKDHVYYRRLMAQAFAEIRRVLKPGRWFTLVFHNSSNKIWTLIQEALLEAGFVVADVRAQVRGQGSYKQMTAAMSIKSDLIISAYKPNGGLEERFKLEAGTEEGVWDFVRTHLKQLPVFVSKDGQAEVIAERQNYLLFDRMVAFHVQRGVTVPLSAAEFYAGLEQRFPPRDGMYFLPDQAAEYDKKRMTVKEVLQLQLFVSDEASAIQWLKQLLTKKPQTFQDIHPQFLKERSTRSPWSFPSCWSKTSCVTTARARCPARFTATSLRTSRSFATWPRTIRRSRQRPRTAGMCPIRTRPATWRSCASGP